MQAEKEAQKIVQKGILDREYQDDSMLTRAQPENVCFEESLFSTQSDLFKTGRKE